MHTKKWKISNLCMSSVMYILVGNTDNSISRALLSGNCCHRPGMIHSGHSLIYLIFVHRYFTFLHWNKEQQHNCEVSDRFDTRVSNQILILILTPAVGVISMHDLIVANCSKRSGTVSEFLSLLFFHTHGSLNKYRSIMSRVHVLLWCLMDRWISR